MLRVLGFGSSVDTTVHASRIQLRNLNGVNRALALCLPLSLSCVFVRNLGGLVQHLFEPAGILGRLITTWISRGGHVAYF